MLTTVALDNASLHDVQVSTYNNVLISLLIHSFTSFFYIIFSIYIYTTDSLIFSPLSFMYLTYLLFIYLLIQTFQALINLVYDLRGGKMMLEQQC